MTIDAVRCQQKTVTRRHVNTWRNLKPGDHLTLIEKGMGLPKGASQVVLCEVEIVDVRVEPLLSIYHDPTGTLAEGLPQMAPHEFVTFWMKGHGYPSGYQAADVPCRRIEWRYLTGSDQ